ncbi:restriction endonuclease S subunit [Lachnospiraceae bacterium PM6-15]|uniref:restriction endonuclease subunit S n=1 Tax=Ohessyouella blattaphilus TaxID=2949333 RepID=UPI003E2AFEEC
MSNFLISSNEKNKTGEYGQGDILAASLGTELVRKHIFFGLRSTAESIKNYRIANLGDVIYTKSPIKGYPNGIIRTNKGAAGIVPSMYCVYHSSASINPDLIQTYFEDKYRLNAYLYPLVNVGARNNVNITDSEFLEGNILIPLDAEEQNRIVNFFNQLNNTIALHQRKQSHKKEMKLC